MYLHGVHDDDVATHSTNQITLYNSIQGRQTFGSKDPLPPFRTRNRL